MTGQCVVVVSNALTGFSYHGEDLAPSQQRLPRHCMGPAAPTSRGGRRVVAHTRSCTVYREIDGVPHQIISRPPGARCAAGVRRRVAASRAEQRARLRFRPGNRLARSGRRLLKRRSGPCCRWWCITSPATAGRHGVFTDLLTTLPGAARTTAVVSTAAGAVRRLQRVAIGAARHGGAGIVGPRDYWIRQLGAAAKAVCARTSAPGPLLSGTVTRSNSSRRRDPRQIGCREPRRR